MTLNTRRNTKQPSLAALAYYAEVPYGGTCSGNPGSCYCSQLGGSDLFGEGETGLMVYAILLRYWEWTPEEDVRPRV